jgi:hypothetical protein
MAVRLISNIVSLPQISCTVLFVTLESIRLLPAGSPFDGGEVPSESSRQGRLDSANWKATIFDSQERCPTAGEAWM